VWSLNRENRAILSDLALVARLADLDPTSRRLSSKEKLRRGIEILATTVNQIRVCLKDRDPPQKLANLLAQAQSLNAENVMIAPSNEAAESRLDLAEKLWADRAAVCDSPPAAGDPLALLMTKLEQ